MGIFDIFKKPAASENPLSQLEKEILRFWNKRETDYEIPDYYDQSEFGRNVEPVRKRLLKDGYLEIAGIQTAVSLKTLPELKAFLKEKGLSASGTKAVLIQRILDSFPEAELKKLFPVSRYQATEKGAKILDELVIAKARKDQMPSNINDCFTQENYAAGDEHYRTLYSKMIAWVVEHYEEDGSITSNNQKYVLETLMRDPTRDLYILLKSAPCCPICAPLEGRVYSRSGTDTIFPPLALAFQKIDPDGPDVLWNTLLLPHPGAIACITPWTPAGRTREELDEIKRFSSLKTNPLSRAPRTPGQIEAYEKAKAGREAFQRSLDLYDRCSELGIEGFPKTFKTFDKHRRANSEKYLAWMQAYSKATGADPAEEGARP